MKITLCGAGNSALGMAADMAFMGHAVTMFELPQFSANLDPIREQGGIDLKGPSQSKKNGIATLAWATSLLLAPHFCISAAVSTTHPSIKC